MPVELSPGVPATLITGYEAALEVLRDPTTFRKDPRGWQRTVPDDCPVLPMMMYRPNCRHADGAAHSRLRMAVTDSLSRADLFALRGYVETSADTLIGRFAGKGTADLVADYARVLPLLVFNELFGCPPDIGDRLVQGMSGIFDTRNARRSNEILRDAVVELVQLKRREPGQDVTSWLIAHPVRLTDEEMMHQLTTLLGAGTEPTQNLIVNGLRLLLADERFAGDLSGGNLQVEDAIDEVLWTEPPLANFAMTYPAQDVDFAGVRLPKDQPVVISLAAANTDPSLASEQPGGQPRPPGLERRPAHLPRAGPGAPHRVGRHREGARRAAGDGARGPGRDAEVAAGPVPPRADRAAGQLPAGRRRPPGRSRSTPGTRRPPSATPRRTDSRPC